MRRIRGWLADHSFTIFALALAGVFLRLAWPEPEFNWWDIWLGLFHGLCTVALLNFLAGWTRERNRPED